MKTKALMKVGDEVKHGMVEVLAQPNYMMKTEQGFKIYPAALMPTKKDLKRGQVGFIVDRCFIPLMSFTEFVTGIRREAIFKEHLSFIGWEMLRLKAIAMKDQYKLRDALKSGTNEEIEE